MASRRIQAVRHADGHLALLEPVELPAGPMTVTLDLPETAHDESAQSLGGRFPQLRAITWLLDLQTIRRL